MMSEAPSTDPRTCELSIERLFDAPREMVFEVWTKPEHQVHWMGPKGFAAPSCEIDFRVGGAYRTCIVDPTGVAYWMRGEYREIVVPERIVFTFAWEEEGERGIENLITLRFTEEGLQTRLAFHQAPFHSIEERDGHHGGWTECFDRLAAYLETGRIAENASEKI